MAKRKKKLSNTAVFLGLLLSLSRAARENEADRRAERRLDQAQERIDIMRMRTESMVRRDTVTIQMQRMRIRVMDADLQLIQAQIEASKHARKGVPLMVCTTCNTHYPLSHKSACDVCGNPDLVEDRITF